MLELDGSGKARICSDTPFCGHRTYGTIRTQVSIPVSCFFLIYFGARISAIMLPASSTECDSSVDLFCEKHIRPSTFYNAKSHLSLFLTARIIILQFPAGNTNVRNASEFTKLLTILQNTRQL